MYHAMMLYQILCISNYCTKQSAQRITAGASAVTVITTCRCLRKVNTYTWIAYGLFVWPCIEQRFTSSSNSSNSHVKEKRTRECRHLCSSGDVSWAHLHTDSSATTE
jgi:hypothetical protein